MQPKPTEAFVRKDLTAGVPDITHEEMQKTPCASLMAHGWMIASSGQIGMLASKRAGSTGEESLEDR